MVGIYQAENCNCLCASSHREAAATACQERHPGKSADDHGGADLDGDDYGGGDLDGDDYGEADLDDDGGHDDNHNETIAQQYLTFYFAQICQSMKRCRGVNHKHVFHSPQKDVYTRNSLNT